MLVVHLLHVTLHQPRGLHTEALSHSILCVDEEVIDEFLLIDAREVGREIAKADEEDDNVDVGYLEPGLVRRG